MAPTSRSAYDSKAWPSAVPEAHPAVGALGAVVPGATFLLAHGAELVGRRTTQQLAVLRRGQRLAADRCNVMFMTRVNRLHKIYEHIYILTFPLHD